MGEGRVGVLNMDRAEQKRQLKLEEISFPIKISLLICIFFLCVFLMIFSVRKFYAEIYYMKGRNYLNEGKYERALFDLAKAITFNPVQGKALFYYAKTNYHLPIVSIEDKKAAYGEAAITALRSLTTMTHKAKNYLLLADIYLDTFEFSESEKYANKARILDPGNENIPYLFGRYYYNKKDYDKAIEQFMAVDFSKLQRNDLFKWIGFAYYKIAQNDEKKQQEYNNALRYFLKYLQGFPDDFEIHHFIADIYIGKKHYDLGIDYFERLQKKYTLSDILINDLGSFYLPKRRFKEALECFNKAIEINPNYAPAYKNLGTTYMYYSGDPNQSRDYSKTVIYWEKYLELEKKDTKSIEFVQKRLPLLKKTLERMEKEKKK